MSKFSQWISVAVSSWYTWLIYISNTPLGSEAQSDLVAWISHLALLVAVSMFWMERDFLAQLKPKGHMIKACGDVNILAQIFLLVVTGHWWLAAVRAAAEIIARKLVDDAVDYFIWGVGRNG